MLTVQTENSCGEPVMMSDVVYPEVWCDEILHLAQVTGVPITAYVEDIKIGKGLSGLGVKAVPGVVVTHKDTPGKYLKVVGVLDKMGHLTYASKYLAGSSATLRKQKAAAVISASMKSATGDGKNMLSSALSKLAAKDRQKEQMYYDAVHNIMQQALDDSVGIQPTSAPTPTPPPAPVPKPKPVAPPPAPKPKTATPPPRPAAKPAAAVDRVFFRCRKCNKQFRIQKRDVVINFTCTQCGHKFRVDCSKNT